MKTPREQYMHEISQLDACWRTPKQVDAMIFEALNIEAEKRRTECSQDVMCRCGGCPRWDARQ